MKHNSLSLFALLLILTACRCGGLKEASGLNSTQKPTAQSTEQELNSTSNVEGSSSPNPTSETNVLNDFVSRYGSEVTCIPHLEQGVPAQVTRVIDGDSIEVRIGDSMVQVRYIGINTPEYYSDDREQAIIATQANQELLRGGQVLLFKDVSETDKFGRLLRYVLTDQAFVNFELVEGGYAEARKYRPDNACYSVFVQAQP